MWIIPAYLLRFLFILIPLCLHSFSPFFPCFDLIRLYCTGNNNLCFYYFSSYSGNLNSKHSILMLPLNQGYVNFFLKQKTR